MMFSKATRTKAVRILPEAIVQQRSSVQAPAFFMQHPFDAVQKWHIITRTIIDHTQALLAGYIPRETTGTAACTMITLAHARLAVYAPPRIEMALEATAPLGESPSPPF